MYVYEKGLMVGVADDRFGSETDLSRAMIVTIEQLAALIHRTQVADGKAPPDILMDYEWHDWDNISDWAKGVVNVLTIQGIFADIPGTDLNPRDPATRAEVASMFYKWLSAIEEAE